MRVSSRLVDRSILCATLAVTPAAAAQTSPGASATAQAGASAAAPAPTLPSGMEPGAPTTSAILASAPVRWDHRNQLGLRVGFSEGYRLTIRYDASPQCSNDPMRPRFCADRSPVMLDTALGFGVSEGVELDARFRLGLETELDGARPLQLGLGIRSLSSAENRLKFFIAFAFLADLARAGGSGVDAFVRAEQGFQFDVERWFGFYVQAGESFGFLQSFATIIDANVGVQVRTP